MVLKKLKGHSVFHRIGNAFGKYFDGDHFLGRASLESSGKSKDGNNVTIKHETEKKLN